MRKKIITFIIIVMALLSGQFSIARAVAPSVAPSVAPCPSTTTNCFNSGDIENNALANNFGTAPQHGSALGNYISIFWRSSVIIAGLAFLGYLIIGGFKYLMAGGDQKATLEARSILIHALLGLGIIVSSYVIIKIVESIFGLTIISGPLSFPIP